MSQLQSYMEEEDLPGMVILKDICKTLRMNMITLGNSGRPYANALYLGMSILHHSCKPNAMHIGPTRKMKIVALCDIPEKKPEMITVSFLNEMFPKEKRQKFILEKKRENCNCSFCTDPEEERKMTEVLDREKAEGLDGVVALSERTLKDIKLRMITGANVFHLLSLCENCLKKQTDVLGKAHILRLQILEIAFCLTVNVPLNERQGIEYGNELLELLKYYYGEYNPRVAEILFKKALLFKRIQDLDNAEKTAIEALRILSVTFKSTNRNYQRLVEFIDECKEEKLETDEGQRRMQIFSGMMEMFGGMWI